LQRKPSFPNRSDLLWDDYDGLFQAARDEFKGTPSEENPILNSSRSTTDARKLITYAGSLDQKTRFSTVDNLQNKYIDDWIEMWGNVTAEQKAEISHLALGAFGGMMATYFKKKRQ
jgi:hypothetical protein